MRLIAGLALSVFTTITVVVDVMSATGSAVHGEIKVDVAGGAVVLYDDVKLLAQRCERGSTARILLPAVQHHCIPANREQ